MHDAERVAGFVEVSETRERKFHMTDFAQRTAPHDALVGQPTSAVAGFARVNSGMAASRRGSLDDTGGSAKPGATFP